MEDWGLALSADERAAFARGVAEFNEGRYFDCHDTLEEIWQGLRGPARDFLQGLIQVAVAFHHLARFARYPARCYGFDLEAHRAEIQAWLARLEAGADLDAARPRWHFDPEVFA
jgi:predicted transcriptional regulator